MENDWFDAAAVKEWLEKKIRCQKELKSLDDFNGQISTAVTPDYIQLTSGIDIVADILGEKLEEGGAVDEYTRYCFIYNGTKVIQLSQERLVRHDGAD